MKIGYLLLTADPLHIGHIALAAKCINEGILDEVKICPTVQNPWKDAPIATFEDRCEMIQFACEHLNHCELENIEHTLFPPYYSCNTLEALYNKYGRDKNEHWIIGGTDTVDSLPDWMNYETMIKGRFKVVAFTRGGKKPETDKVPYVLVESDIPDLSSTYVRRLISTGQNPYPYIPECILDMCNRIYSDSDKTTEFYV